MGRVWFLVPILTLATWWLYILTYHLAPTVAGRDGQVELKFPSNLAELRNLSDTLQRYYEVNWLYVIVLFSSAYIYKQTFAIPGSVLLNVLAGALFGVVIGFPLCCILTAIGATNCYLLSKFIGQEILEYFFLERIRFLQSKVRENENRLPFFLLFLRLFPMTPNWFINMASPIIGVPLPLFFVTVLTGLMPYNFLCVQAGGMLSSLRSLQDLFSISVLLRLAAMAGAVLGPSFFIKRKVDKVD